jgi:hypothetical protein
MFRTLLALTLLSLTSAEAFAQNWGGSNTGIRRQQTCTTHCTGTGDSRVCTTTCY